MPTNDVERQDEQEHGEYEMVGSHHGQHHVGKRKRGQRQQHRYILLDAHLLLEDAPQENHRVESGRDDGNEHHEHGTVLAGQCRQPMVQQIERIEQDGEKGMTEHVVFGRPVGENGVGEGVEARQLVVLAELPREPTLGGGNHLVVAYHHHRIIECQHDGHHGGKHTLVLAYLEQVIHASS